MIVGKSEDLVKRIMTHLKENEDKTFTLKELAIEANVFLIDVEFCIRALFEENMIIAKWIKIIKEEEIVDHVFYITLNKDWKPEEKMVSLPPDLMYR